MKAEKKGDALLLSPSSDFVEQNADDLLDFLKKSLSGKSDVKIVELDAGNVENIDSIGINLLVGLSKQASAEGRQLQIVNSGGKFKKIVDIIRITGVKESDSEETSA